MASFQRPAVNFSQTEVVGTTKWLRLETLTYTDQTGKPRLWDRSVRTTRQSEEAEDAVAILATLRHSADPEEDEILLVQQFRPAVNAYTLELPAGLIDKGETAQDAALRELKEECGYVGQVTDGLSPALPMSPGMTNENVVSVAIDVDMSLAENQSPKQELDEGEFCTVHRVRKCRLLTELREMIEEDPKLHVISLLWTMAQGIEMGLQMAGKGTH